MTHATGISFIIVQSTNPWRLGTHTVVPAQSMTVARLATRTY